MNRIETAVTSVAGEMTALEVGSGIVPVAATSQATVKAIVTPTALQTFTLISVSFAVMTSGCGAAAEYTTFMGESSGLSVGDLLQARRGL